MHNAANETPRERVLAALAHRQPSRIPFAWGFCLTEEMARNMAAFLAERGMDWPRLRAAASDIDGIGPVYTGPRLVPDTDIWGIRRKKVVYGDGAGGYDEVEVMPLAGADLHAVERYPWPDPAHWDCTGMRASATVPVTGRRKALRLGGGNPFEIYCWMTGLEEAMTNLLVAPEVVAAALERITAFFEARLRCALAAGGDLVDLVFLADDLGGQQGLLLSRQTYRDVIQPTHRRLCHAVREMAPRARIMFHTDGAVFEIIPDLLDAGIDVLEAVQTDAAGMDPARLKATYGDRLSFHGAISVQQLLPRADAATVERECRRLVAVLGAGGGYIAAPAHAVQVGTPPANVLAMLRGVLGERDYEAALTAAR